MNEMLQSIFNFNDAVVLHKNTDYDFCIRLAKPENKKYCLLYTDGLSKHLQQVDEKNKKFARIELYFLLPEYWDFSKKNWPVFWLNKIAQVPQKNKTWFGLGDTLPAGNPPQEIDEILKCSYFILSEPLFLESEFVKLSKIDETVSFMAVIPIFTREFDFKMQNSASALLKIFKEKAVYEMIDLYRQPVARKRFMGIF